MYVPPHFKEDEVPVLHAAMRAARLGTLVTLGADGLIASHVPFLVDAGPGPFGTLRGHVSRANSQWRDLAAGTEALAMFLGPDAYITPAWYAVKRETGKVVPTWNYVAIHAYGTIRFFDDAGPLRAVVTELTTIHEGKRAEPWAVSDAPADFITAHLKGIVGFELPITRLEGKWKMSQNRSAVDRKGVVDGLADEGGPAEQAVAAIMAGDGPGTR